MQGKSDATSHQHYKYASGREGDAAVVGLASNKRYISQAELERLLRDAAAQAPRSAS